MGVLARSSMMDGVSNMKNLTKLTAVAASAVLAASPALSQDVSNAMTAVTTASNTNAGLTLGAIAGIAASLIGLAYVTGIVRTAIGFGKSKK